MAATMEELEKRVVALERELSALRRQDRASSPSDESREAFMRRVLQGMSVDQAVFSAGFAKSFAEMGITAQPIGAENLQKMLLAGGLDPNDNSFSRGIIEMREE